jgi:hypothetical protein
MTPYLNDAKKKKRHKHSIPLKQQIGTKQKSIIFIIYNFIRKLPATEGQKIG